MSKQIFIEVTHNTLNTKVYICILNLFSFYYSEAHKATLLMAAGGAMVPIKETVKEVEQMLQKVNEQC